MRLWQLSKLGHFIFILWRLTYVALPGDGVDRRARRHIALKVDVIPFLYAVGVQLAAQTQVQNGTIWKKILSLRMIYPTNLDQILLSGSNHSQKLKRKMYGFSVRHRAKTVFGLQLLRSVQGRAKERELS